MPLLRADYIPIKVVLSGVWEVAADRAVVRKAESENHRAVLLLAYFCENRTRKPRPIHVFIDRKAVNPEPSGRETLAAAKSRSRCVFCDGCPVLSLHLSFGLAAHIGQRTDNICPRLRFAGFTR